MVENTDERKAKMKRREAKGKLGKSPNDGNGCWLPWSTASGEEWHGFSEREGAAGGSDGKQRRSRGN